MTSPSLKNHPTTASLPAIRSNDRTLWKRCLAGALCLLISGAIPAADREVGKPLERLKQRSARQRWRELRGEWTPAPEVNPQAPPSALPQPAVSGSTTEKRSLKAPVPAPITVTPEVERPVVARPGAKPPSDPHEPMAHQGSFGDIPLETRATAPRERVTISLPHWPFSDDLDLIQQPLPEAATDTTVAAPAQHVGDAVSGEASPERSADSFPIRVAEVPAPPATPETPAPPATPRQPAEAVAAAPQPEPDPIQNLKSIKDIQPFYDYAPQGGDPNESLCPRPAGADPNKTYKECPVESELMLQGSLERNHSIIPVYWQASNVSHNPLYFEDSGLERNGHSFSNAVQPFVSAGKFGAQVIALPYTVALDPVWKRETPLGHYRPGECAPKRHLALPINGRAAVVAAATYTGIIYLIP